MTRYVIGIGSNIDAATNLERAVDLLGVRMQILQRARIQQTSPLCFADQPDFLNTAVLVESVLNPTALRDELKAIENELGRQPSSNKNGPRPIDLDILVADNEILDEDVYSRGFLVDSIVELLPHLRDRLAR
jgi:2-amino-4-hydroxy-6-hydroxymethyldihydropteridine diphosphokinase